jgi:hypothetical protein
MTLVFRSILAVNTHNPDLAFKELYFYKEKKQKRDGRISARFHEISGWL